ncbi:unnamed protein product [Caenorhabditis auriculariae]|uniref:Uncharacterized protein n=1 Tax=Caenorhabditis auriculariae TaxID=2777116 RepID=A0A8S1H146_9PELO|nr:unnamed protein product [Caenorhabditis auriculariae]
MLRTLSRRYTLTEQEFPCPILLEDYLIVFHDYALLAGNYQFTEAMETVERFKSTKFSRKDGVENPWIQILGELITLAKNDKAFYTCSFLVSRAFFRRNSTAKDQYMTICETIQRMRVKFLSDPAMELLIDDLMTYSRSRAESVKLISGLAAWVHRKEPVDWKRHLGETEAIIAKFKQPEEEVFLLKPADLRPTAPLIEPKQTAIAPCEFLNPIIELALTELNILKNLFKTQIGLNTCELFTCMSSLALIRSEFVTAVKEVQMADGGSAQKSFFFSQITKPSPKNKLIYWYAEFYDLLLAKFSLYFANAIGTYCESSEVQKIHEVDNGHNFINRCVEFYKKSNAFYLAIVQSRTEGPRYNSPFDVEELYFAPRGEEDQQDDYLYPLIFRLPSPTHNDHRHEDLEYFDQDDVHRMVDGFVRKQLIGIPYEYSGATKVYTSMRDVTAYGARLELDTYLVVIYEGSAVNEKKHNPVEFIHHLSNDLKCVKLIRTLRARAKV